MKMTIDLPDELTTEVKIEAARQKKKLKELVPELLRAGLRARPAESPRREVSERWLDAWVALGHESTEGLDDGPTASHILATDRGRLDKA